MASSSKGGGGSRSRPYGMMLLLAFGAAVLGVMVLHKLRERRIFSLLIQDKDQDLLNLHLLLKKERESCREYKRKMEDLKAKANSLRAQKMELSNKIATLQSVTTSLKDEQRVLESTIEEKQTTIKMLQQEKTYLNEGSSQVAALKELLKQKEAEIEAMKRVPTEPTKIWSVSTDDPSKPLVNGTFAVVSEKAVNSDHEEVDGDLVVKDVGEKSHNVSEATAVKDNHAGHTEELENDHNGEGSSGKSDDGEKKLEESQTKEQIPGEELKAVDNNPESGGFITENEKDTTNKTEVTRNHLDDGALSTEGQSGNAMAANGTEQELKLGDPEEGGNGNVMKEGMEQFMANV